MKSRVRNSAGILVLGVHRSGTSALTHMLNLGGADVGSRVRGASAGNETGHWEDSLAVEVHERLLSSFGTRWDEAFALPADWMRGEAAAAACDTIYGYLESNRAKHKLWAAKDPRLSLFAGLWREAAAKLHLPLGAILVLRHPMEVARSLAARDGIAPGRALLLWLDYALAAAAQAEQIPSVVIEYSQLLADWRACVDKVRRLPGAGMLAYDDTAAAVVDSFLDPELRHHSESDTAGMPRVVAEVWEILSGVAKKGALPKGTAASLARRVAAVRELVHPLLDEWRVTQRLLWERVARAEAPLAQLAAADTRSDGLEEHVRLLTSHINSNQEAVIEAISGDLRRMQDVTATALQSAATREREAELIRQIAPRLVRLEELVPRHEATVAALANAEFALTLAKAEMHATQLNLAGTELLRQQTLRQLEASEQQLGLLLAASDEHQREIAGLRLVGERLRELAEQLELVKGSRSWRWTRPMRVIRRLISGKWTSSDASKLRRLMRSALVMTPFLSRQARTRLIEKTLATEGGHTADLPDAAMAPMIKLAGQQVGVPDVFVWSVIDWHFRTQRPQHLASALAEKGHRVFYISNNFVVSPEPGFRIDPLGDEGRLFQIHLHHEHVPAIYFGMPDEIQTERMRASLARLLEWTCTHSSMSIVQHPYWSALVRAVPNARVVYDCMDHHAGFDNNAASVLKAERKLVENSDLVIVTSTWLENEVRPQARATALIRNAGEFEFFRHRPRKVFRDDLGRQVIGYYGAIAEWFDLDLIRHVALANPESLVLLVGSDTVGAAEALADLSNIRLAGEVPYAQLPYWLYGFDVCVLPFKVIPLTLATNPVKIYEYLAAGKPVVAVDLPEMAQFDGLIERVSETNGFVAAVKRVLAAKEQQALVAARQTFAAGQTWEHRAKALDDALARIEDPRVSIVVLTYNNLAFTEACLFSIETYSDYSNLEIIVVDNASSDGSREWLQQWASEQSAAGHQRKLIFNDANLGFSAGNNVGLHASTGDVLVILNNDTYVTPGWIRTLCAHLERDHELGLVGPVTNNIGNEAKVDIGYTGMDEMIATAAAYTRAHPGQSIPLRNAAFFCVAMPRRVYEKVGDMDEDFGVGFFEDDDYCRRVEQAGFRIACAEDVFVHHHLSASFDKLGAERKREMFERNKTIYERKWGPWQPHKYR